MAALDDEEAPTPVAAKTEAEDSFDIPQPGDGRDGGKKGKKDKKKKKGPKGLDVDALLEGLDEQEAEGGKAAAAAEKPEAAYAAAPAPAAAVEEQTAAIADDDALLGDFRFDDEEDSDAEDDEEGAEEGAAPRETREDRMKRTRPPPKVRISAGSSQPGFVSLRLEKVAVAFKNQDVLTDATWELKTGDRLGLVGVNGGGKTTQLKILAGELEPLSGDIVKSRADLRLAYLKQEFIDELDLNRTLREELLSVFEKEYQVLADLEQAQKDLEAAATDALDQMDEVLERMNRLQGKADQLDVDSMGARVDKVMAQMGFVPQDADEKVSAFSGGWKMRIGLGKILLQDPNVLLLDEPTNHLDIASVEWMENFLRNQNLPMVIVSHDREFLDQVCTGIVDCEQGVTTQYDGNYSRFLKLKKARMDAWESAWQNQERKIKEDQTFIKRNKMDSTKGGAVQSRIKNLERLKASKDYVRRPPRPTKPFKFRFPPAPRSSGAMLVLDEVTHGYDGNMLFEDVSLEFERGDRVAFLGPNGAGKSTLLRLAVGREQPQSGTAEPGGASVKVNYFEQNQADALNLELTVLQTLEEVSVGVPYNELRALLGQFLFKGDDVYKQVKNLSGGEKGRLALCRMMMQPANVLVLDEPTNHLDIPAKEMLEEALRYYDGTVLVVSHDRYFISQVANTICDIVDKDLEIYPGDYRFYMEKNREMKEKIESRYVDGVDGIKQMKKVEVFLEEVDDKVAKKKKNFGGKGGPSGNKNKGVKNAKRMS
mmetsp:Transcript_39094/g.67606  ORF Transcript_39094/g.67606 Transcript_39094/m.67606 type:complete len:766 (-) Transcript_39094:128-2425(-)